ncbi:hypothetical protein C4588_07230 [Candidatus Parcubacteria bacterium]|nr:MAG: hypothetical protein C4588_07230 [Candidatus Parcubacteria bacterium]
MQDVLIAVNEFLRSSVDAESLRGVLKSFWVDEIPSTDSDSLYPSLVVDFVKGNSEGSLRTGIGPRSDEIVVLDFVLISLQRNSEEVFRIAEKFLWPLFDYRNIELPAFSPFHTVKFVSRDYVLEKLEDGRRFVTSYLTDLPRR